MARYIDADALLDKLKELKEEWGFTFTADGVEEAIFKVEEEPTADVVPKSEVEMLQGALKAEERHNELTMEMAQKALKNAKADVAREIFEEIWRIGDTINGIILSPVEFTELKKKYTEEKE